MAVRVGVVRVRHRVRDLETVVHGWRLFSPTVAQEEKGAHGE